MISLSHLGQSQQKFDYIFSTLLKEADEVTDFLKLIVTFKKKNCLGSCLQIFLGGAAHSLAVSDKLCYLLKNSF